MWRAVEPYQLTAAALITLRPDARLARVAAPPRALPCFRMADFDLRKAGDMDTAFTVALTTSPIAFAAMRVRRAMGVATFAAFGGDAIAAGSFSMGFGVGSSGDARQANGLRVACIGESGVSTTSIIACTTAAGLDLL